MWLVKVWQMCCCVINWHSLSSHSGRQRLRAVMYFYTAQIWMKIDPYYQRQKCRPMILFWKYKVYGDIRGGSSWRRRQMRVRLTTTAIFGDLSGYFFGIFTDKASSIMWRHATRCRPVTDCKMNDLKWPWAFSANTLLQHKCVFWSPLHKFKWR